jgi:antitoxin CptB
MDTPEKARLRWGCRRGMLELDLILIPFFDRYFDNLAPKTQTLFEQLLTQADPDLFQWLMGYSVPTEEGLVDMVSMIRAKMSIPLPTSKDRVSRTD